MNKTMSKPGRPLCRFASNVAVVELVCVVSLRCGHPAPARTVAVPRAPSDSPSGATTMTASSTTGPVHVTLLANEEVVFAEISLEEALTPGTEIEAWPQVDGETAPWDFPEGTSSFDRNYWVTDERTGSLASFDFTKIVRAWDAGALENLGFKLRIVGNTADGKDSSLQAAVKPTTPQNARTTCHIQPVRLPATGEAAGRPDEPPSGRVPTHENAGSSKQPGKTVSGGRADPLEPTARECTLGESEVKWWRLRDSNPDRTIFVTC